MDGARSIRRESATPRSLLLRLLLLLSLLAAVTLSPVTAAVESCGDGRYSDGFVRPGSMTVTGSQAWLYVASPATELRAGASWSVEAWARRDAAGGWHDYVFFSSGKGSGTTWGPGTRENIHLGMRADGRVFCGFWGDDLHSTSTITDNNWHFYVFTFDGSTWWRGIYVDGTPWASGKAGGVPNSGQSQQQWIGTAAQYQSFRWEGEIDELMIFNLVLNPATVTRHYNGDFWGWLTPAAGLMQWYKFNEGSGNTAMDSARALSTNSANWVEDNKLWRGGTDGNRVCIKGYWVGYRIERNSLQNVPLAGWAQVTVHMIDQYGNKMSDYTTLPPSTGTTAVTLLILGSGPLLPGPQLLQLGTNGKATVNFQSGLAETVQFALIDTAGNGRPTAVTSPTQTFDPRRISNIELIANPPASISPAVADRVLSYSASLPSRTDSFSIRVTYLGFAPTIRVDGVAWTATDAGGQLTSNPIPIDTGTQRNITIEGTDDGTYTLTVQRRVMAMTAWQLLAAASSNLAANAYVPLAAVALTPALAQNVSSYSASVSYLPARASLLITFDSIQTQVTVSVNGVSFGPLVSDQPIDVSSALTTDPTSSNVFAVTSTADGTFTATLTTGCPMPYTCLPLSGATDAEFECLFCDPSNQMRRVRLKHRPPCCGQQHCQC